MSSCVRWRRSCNRRYKLASLLNQQIDLQRTEPGRLDFLIRLEFDHLGCNGAHFPVGLNAANWKSLRQLRELILNAFNRYVKRLGSE